MTRRLRIVAALTVALVLLAASPAAAHTTTTARSGEGVIRIVQRVCGTSQGWQQVAAENGITAASGYRVLLGQSLSVGCPSGTSATPSSSQAWRTPVDLSACFRPNGSREFGVQRPGHLHGGIDLGSPVGVYAGEPVYAAAAGTIIAAGYSGNAGYRVNIRHTDGSTTKAFHLSRIARWSGSVQRGTVIGYVGATGNATGPHVHYETFTASGARVDPVRFLADRGVRIGC